MSPEKQREIASKGGQAAHRKGTAHEFSSEEAREAGRLGGKIISTNRAHMAIIGRKGGQHSLFSQRAAKTTQEKAAPEGLPRDQQGGSLGDKPMPMFRSHGATDLLREDHRRVNSLFHQYEAQDRAQGGPSTLVQQLCTELEIHARIEEDIFYPTLRKYLDESDRHQIDEGLREHQQIKELVMQVQKALTEESPYDHLVQDLYKRVDHHVYEEEQNLLPEAEQCLGDQLEELEAQMRQHKHQYALDVTEVETPSDLIPAQAQE
jgi:general stress protein YciG/iron-sulfur cluster repair protein YtfE (RIC family)